MIAVLHQRAVIVPHAVRLAVSSRRAVTGTIVLFLVVLFFYAMLLPATSTGGAVDLASLRFLTPVQLALAAVMAALLALAVALGVHDLRHGAKARPTGSVLGAVLAIVPALLCCSPILPLTIATIASVLPAAGQLGLPIQGFIATHEGGIYGVAIALMLWGVYGNARRVLSCAR
ncbi:MAG: hypothetical protein ACREFO_17205 [Acetobacteraceae bacterium]